MRSNLGWFFSIAFVLSCTSALGADADFSDNFNTDHHEMALMSGAMFSPIGADKGRSTENYSLTGLQYGWMMTDLVGGGFLRGNWDISLEAMGGRVFTGKGTYIVGGTLWFRYNFVQANWRVVPYIQAGGGAEALDMDTKLIGQTFNFNLDVAAGARYFVARNWSVNLECRYQHLSNARLSNHDLGINAVGPMVGVSYFF
jgi:lipid A 3-O-deacylase